MDDKELTQNIEQEVKKEVEDVKSHVELAHHQYLTREQSQGHNSSSSDVCLA